LHIADLFAGCGSLSLPLIDHLAGLLAVEADSAALTALKAGVDAAGFGGRLTTQQRDLFDLPLLPDELTKVTAVILDPPRSGAIAQCQQIAKSHITTIAMAACNPASFARDAACLTAAGFRLDWVQPIDQFKQSNHLELVGAFSR
jgi:23S rRNA (uracil1939-C5)-methyltransferase